MQRDTFNIVCFGTNHASAGGGASSLAFSPEQLGPLLAQLAGEEAIAEALAISTPHRTEFYLGAEDATAARQCLVERLRDAGKLDDEALRRTYTHRDENAVRHLMRAAAGLDAPVLGESEVLGHIRQAHETALNRGTCGEILSTLASRAIALGTRLRDEPELARLYLSVVTVALRVAGKIFGNLAERRVVLAGCGETGRLLARQLAARGVREMSVWCPSTERGADAARELGGEAIAAEQLGPRAREADILVWALEPGAAAPHEAIARTQRTGREQVIFDLAKDSGLAGAVKLPEEVLRFPLEVLERSARQNRSVESRELARVEELLEEEVERFVRWLNQREVARVLEQLREGVEAIRRNQIERYGRNLTEEESRRLDEFTRSLLQTVMEDVTGNVRRIDLESELGAKEFGLICELFNIRPEEKEDR